MFAFFIVFVFLLCLSFIVFVFFFIVFVFLIMFVFFYRVCPSMFFSMLGLFSILALSLFLQAKIEGTYSRGPLLGRESM